MKTFLRISILFFLFLTVNLFGQESCYQFPTFADPPGPENVLVIYSQNHAYSDSIKDYYMEKRSIPVGTHEIGITLPTNPPGITYGNDGEVIKGEGLTAWNFVKVEIADEIENHLNTTYYNGELLRDLIRYIVLCKGIPLKIEDSNGSPLNYRQNVSIDALMCLLNQESSKHFLELYGTNISSGNPTNPYYAVDETFSLDYRFLPHHFTNEDGWKLNYLVTRLDGNTEEEIELMIDNAFNSDITGDKTWILDEDPTTFPTGHILSTFSRFNAITGFDTYFDNSEEWITENDGDVIGYVSHGVHACNENCMPSTYIIDGTIEFDYAPGAIFNSVESYNGWSFNQNFRNDQGLVTDFIQKEGTGGVGNVWEPGEPNVCQSSYTFPQYAIGYNLVDAIYQGIPQIGYMQSVAGDPLTIIYDASPIILPNNYTFSAGTYDEHYYVPEGNTVYFNNDGIIRFNRNGSLKIDGNLVISSGAEIQFMQYSKLSIQDAVLNQNSDMTFFQSSKFNINGTLELETNFELTMAYNSILTLGTNSELIFNDNSKVIMRSNSCLVADVLNVNSDSYLKFENNSSLNANSLIIDGNPNLIFDSDQICNVRDDIIIKENAAVTFGPVNCGRLYIQQGASLGYNDISGITHIGSKFIVDGISEDPVFINLPLNYYINFDGNDSVYINYCEWDGGKFNINPGNSGALKFAKIANSNLTNWSGPLTIENPYENNISANIFNCNFNNFSGNGIDLTPKKYSIS